MEFIFDCRKFNKFGRHKNTSIIIRRVNLIGAGNVGHHLGVALKGEVEIVGIYSHDPINAQRLAQFINSKRVDSIELLDASVDLNIICVKDDVINEVAEKLNKSTPAVHTSGSVPLSVFSEFDQTGILYPLQTFSKDREVDMSSIPFLLEASNDSFLKLIREFCTKALSSNTHIVDSETRKKLHLAAVFASNFTTYLLAVSEDILKQDNLDFEILKPLVVEVIQKSFDLGATQAITGPASRNDQAVINKHLDLLSGSKYGEVYKLLTDKIIELKKG